MRATLLNMYGPSVNVVVDAHSFQLTGGLLRDDNDVDIAVLETGGWRHESGRLFTDITFSEETDASL